MLSLSQTVCCYATHNEHEDGKPFFFFSSAHSISLSLCFVSVYAHFASLTCALAHTQLRSGRKSHPALSTGAAGLRLNMCHRVRFGDDKASIKTPDCRVFPACGPPRCCGSSPLPLSSRENGAEASFWQEQLLTKASCLRRSMSHLCSPWKTHQRHDINPPFKSHQSHYSALMKQWSGCWEGSRAFSPTRNVSRFLWCRIAYEETACS